MRNITAKAIGLLATEDTPSDVIDEVAAQIEAGAGFPEVYETLAEAGVDLVTQKAIADLMV